MASIRHRYFTVKNICAGSQRDEYPMQSDDNSELIIDLPNPNSRYHPPNSKYPLPNGYDGIY